MNQFLYLLIAGVAVALPATAQQKQPIRTSSLPLPTGAYNPAVAVNGFLFCAGQIGLDPQTGQLVAGGIEAEVRRTLHNMELVLQAANLDRRNVVSVTVYLKDISHYSLFNRVYEAYFVKDFPARTVVAVADLPAGAQVEITVTAAR